MTATHVTITEALAELKTIQKRMEAKQRFVLSYLIMDARMLDPLQKDGGSVQVVAQERQSLHDLNERRIAIRRAIQAANAATEITVNGTTRTIADWLIWRRDIAPGQKTLLNQMRQLIEQGREQAKRRGGDAVTSDAKPTDVIVNVGETQLYEQIDRLEDTLGVLDGLLSLKNATVTVEY